MKLSKNFTLEEFAQPARHGFKSEPYPTKWISSRLAKLVSCDQKIRDVVGKLIINSAFRSLPYNNYIKSEPTSQHVAGRANDLICPGMSAKKLHDTILRMYRAGELPELGGLGLYPGFVHIDVRDRSVLGRLARWGGSRKKN